MLTPDGQRYLTAAHTRVARPFHLRWLLPKICQSDLRRWKALSWVCVIAIGIYTALYTNNVWMGCVAFLPGIMFNWRHPVLVDATAMALALWSALLFPYCWPAALAVALLAGCIRETAPIWAAIYAWNPLLLIGLLPVAARSLQRQGPDVLDSENAWILKHPIKASRKYHAGLWTDPFTMIAPWGALIAGLADLNAQLATAIAFGYGQLLIATDSVRLYQLAAPVLALSVTHALPSWAFPFIAIGVVFNPWRGSGL